MNLSAPFIRRPVATILLAIGVAMAGGLGYGLLPVAPLPDVDFPTIMVLANMPGASPETMSTTVAMPLERHLGAIADVEEMTSQSSVGTTRIVMQFSLNRDINGAARDVQAAINAARADLPASLRTNPTYRKMNPADAPILAYGITSAHLSPQVLYDQVANNLQQSLSRVLGVGQVDVGGGSLPAVRIQVNPHSLFQYGIGLENVRAAVAAANANTPKGAIEGPQQRLQLTSNAQATKAADYRDLIIAYRNGAAVRLTDVGQVIDGVEDERRMGFVNGQPGLILLVYRQPGANVIETTAAVKATMAQLRDTLPRDVDVGLALDQSTAIKSSLHEVELALIIAVILVIGVVTMFLHSLRAAAIPSVALPVSLLATFGVMYLAGFSLNNLSLMALTIATGFVVDDAIVVLENIARHLELGASRLEAARRGAGEVGFTVVSISFSLVAVFLPLVLMGGIVGRLFQEFAVTLTVAIMVSMVVSLTVTPMMCAYMLPKPGIAPESHGLSGLWDRVWLRLVMLYERSLPWVLRRPRMMLIFFILLVFANVGLFIILPKGLFPEQDGGRLVGRIRADQNISYQQMQQKMQSFMAILKTEPAVNQAIAFTGGRGQTNNGFVFIALHPKGSRAPLKEVMERIRKRSASIPGARMVLFSPDNIKASGRESDAQYQYTLQGDDLDALRLWTDRLTHALQRNKALVDVNSDQEEGGLEVRLHMNRDDLARLGLTISQVGSNLYDAFGQRQVSVIYGTFNQYRVVLETALPFRQFPEQIHGLRITPGGGMVSGTQGSNALRGTVNPPTGQGTTSATDIATDTARNQRQNQLGNIGRGGASTAAAVSPAMENTIPLEAFANTTYGTTPLVVNHQGPFVANTISFNLPKGVSLQQATATIQRTMAAIHVPASIMADFEGAAKMFRQSVSRQPLLILLALVTVYIVLGILYESYIHPLTILSTLPSAGVGTFLALLLTGTEFSIMALIGIILLIGIVKKNAILMIDFALDAERREGLGPAESIHQACLQRFRPIMMTTAASLLSAVPLIMGGGEGSELRRPLGIAIVGGLLLSQLVTLYSTPVIYLLLDRFRHRRHAGTAAMEPAAP